MEKISSVLTKGIIFYNSTESFNFHRIYYSLDPGKENNITLNIDSLLSDSFDFETRTYISVNLGYLKDSKKLANEIDLNKIKECLAYKISKKDNSKILNRSTLISGLNEKLIQTFISACIQNESAILDFKKVNKIS